MLDAEPDRQRRRDHAKAAGIGHRLNRLTGRRGLDLVGGWRGAGLALRLRDDVDMDVAGAADEAMRVRPAPQLRPARAARFRDHDVGEVVGASVFDEALRRVGGRHGDGRAAQPLGQPQTVGDAVALGLAEPLRPCRLDMDRGPARTQPVGEAAGIAHHRVAARLHADAHQHALARGPGALDRMSAHIGDHLLVNPLRGAAQSELAQRGEVAVLEIILHRALGLLRQIDLAVLEALDQVLGREIDHLDIVGVIDDGIGHGLAHPDAGDLGHHVVQALDMLDVERRVDIDAGVEQFLDVEITLRLAPARRVGMLELVDHHEPRPAREDRVEIHLVEPAAFIVDVPARQHLEPGEQRLGLLPAMRLDDADGDVDALALLGLRGLQHLVGLADAGRGAEKDLEPAAPLAPRFAQQGFRRRPLIGVEGVAVGQTISSPPSRRRAPGSAPER